MYICTPLISRFDESAEIKQRKNFLKNKRFSTRRFFSK
uniref:Uncharacterized protein n=1 Tax=Nelumbo nucifera TaxID=4432 RepID=A0A822XSU7_NELNU|nr:TPA_asm: hypothetical protein HUJ06_023439 [Nelumbo nucifera]